MKNGFRVELALTQKQGLDFLECNELMPKKETCVRCEEEFTPGSSKVCQMDHPAQEVMRTYQNSRGARFECIFFFFMLSKLKFSCDFNEFYRFCVV